MRNFTNSIFQEFYISLEIDHQISLLTMLAKGETASFSWKTCISEWHTWSWHLEYVYSKITRLNSSTHRSFINNRIKTVEALSPFLLTPIILSFSRDIYKKHAYRVSPFLFFFIVSINSLLKWNWTQICIYCLFWMEEEYSLRWKEKIKKLYNYFLLVRNICQLFKN